jgi:hypothetical protein
MARVPGVPAPSVAARAPAVPLQQVSAPVQAFGTGGAFGQEVGGALSKAGDVIAAHAFQMQADTNKASADQAAVEYARMVNEAIGDFKSNHVGLDAQDQLPTLYKNLEAMRTQRASGLTPDAATAYQSSSRQSLLYAQTNARDFAVTQRKAALVNTSNAKVKVAVDQAAASDDPTVLANSVASIGQEWAWRMRPDALGLSKEEAEAGVHQDVGEIWSGKVRALIDAGDYPAAESLFDSKRDQMTGQQIVSLDGAMKVGHNSFIANTERQSLLQGKPLVVNGKQDSAPLDAKTFFKKHIRPAEGGYNPSDRNGKPVNFGINQGANPDIDVKNLTEDQAADIFEKRYFKPSGADKLPAGLAAIHSETAFIFGVERAKKMLAQSGGDPEKYLELRQKRFNEMAKQDGGKYIKSWTRRNEQLRQNYAGEGTVIPTPALTPTTDPEEYLAQVAPAIQQYVDLKYAGNPTQATQVQQSMMAAVNQQVRVLNAEQKQRFEKLAGTVLDNSIQDRATLATAYPGAADDLAHLPPNYRNALDASLKRNANEVTVSRGRQHPDSAWAQDRGPAAVRKHESGADRPARLHAVAVDEGTDSGCGEAEQGSDSNRHRSPESPRLAPGAASDSQSATGSERPEAERRTHRERGSLLAVRRRAGGGSGRLVCRPREQASGSGDSRYEQHHRLRDRDGWSEEGLGLVPHRRGPRTPGLRGSEEGPRSDRRRLQDEVQPRAY